MTWDKAKWQQLIERAASGMFCPKVVAKAWSDVTVGSYIYCRYIYIYLGTRTVIQRGLGVPRCNAEWWEFAS